MTIINYESIEYLSDVLNRFGNKVVLVGNYQNRTMMLFLPRMQNENAKVSPLCDFEKAFYK